MKAFENPVGQLIATDWSVERRNWDHLKDFDLPKPVSNGRIHLVISTRNIHLIEPEFQLPIRAPNNQGPVAKLTPIGWLTARPEESREVDSETET